VKLSLKIIFGAVLEMCFYKQIDFLCQSIIAFEMKNYYKPSIQTVQIRSEARRAKSEKWRQGRQGRQ
jgi:hypothetical protein